MENKLLKELNDKLDLFLSLFSIKEDGKEKTLLEKYNENKKEQNDNTGISIRYLNNSRKIDYKDRLRKIMEESFEESGVPPKTDSKGFFIYEELVYNIKDYK